MNTYFICVFVHVQMWCVCAQPCVDQTKKIFVLFVCFWKWFVSPMFFKVSQVVFVWKTCFLGVLVTCFMCKLSYELNGPILKFFQLWIESFTTISWVRLTSEISLVRLTSEIPSFSRKLPDQLFKGISWDICFKRLPSSPKPLF